jgi:hypothetical protein
MLNNSMFQLTFHKMLTRDFSCALIGAKLYSAQDCVDTKIDLKATSGGKSNRDYLDADCISYTIKM